MALLVDRLAPIALVVAAVTAFYVPTLFGPATIQSLESVSDVSEFTRPISLYEFRFASEHNRLPRRFEPIGLGFPGVLLGQHSHHYLPRALAFNVASSAGAASDLWAYTHALAAALLLFALVRFYGIDRYAAAMSGCFYALSEFAIRWTPFLITPAYFVGLPAALLGAELVWARRLTFGVPLAALGVATATLGGGVQSGALVAELVAVLIAFRLVVSQGAWFVRFRKALVATAAVGIGLAVASPTWVPFAIEQSSSVRQESVFAQIAGMDRSTLRGLLHPNLNLATINTDLYLGLGAPVFALAGFVLSLRHRLLAVYPLLLVLGLLIGFKTIVLRVLMAAVPGWDVTSHAGRLATLIMILPLSVLAGVGVQRLLRMGALAFPLALGILLATFLSWFSWMRLSGWEGDPVRIAAVAAGCIVLLGAGWMLSMRGRPPDLGTPLLSAALVLALVAAAVEARDLAWKPGLDRPAAKARSWIELVAENTSGEGRWMSYCLPSQTVDYRYRPNQFVEMRDAWLDAYVSFAPRRYFEYWRALTGNTSVPATGGWWYQHTPNEPEPSGALVNRAAITRVLGSRDCDPDRERLGWHEQARRDGFVVYENREAYPFAYLSSRVEPVRDAAAALRGVETDRSAFATHIDYIERSTLRLAGDSPAVPVRFETLVEGESYRLTLPRPAARSELLVVAESYDAGWRASVGGRAVRVYPINGAFVGIALPVAAKTVELEYAPWWDRWLAPLSAILAVLLVATLVFAVSRASLRGR